MFIYLSKQTGSFIYLNGFQISHFWRFKYINGNPYTVDVYIFSKTNWELYIPFLEIQIHKWESVYSWCLYATTLQYLFMLRCIRSFFIYTLSTKNLNIFYNSWICIYKFRFLWLITMNWISPVQLEIDLLNMYLSTAAEWFFLCKTKMMSP